MIKNFKNRSIKWENRDY